MIECKILFLIIFISSLRDTISFREKRALIFPRGNPTRHQFIAGIGLPVDIDPESMTIGYVFKAQYFLPYNATQLHLTRLSRDIKDVGEHTNNNHHPYDGSSDETKVKSVVGLPYVMEDEDDEVGGVRWSIYQALDLILRHKMKIDGRQCVLRAICEVSQLSFTHESGLLGELLHILLIPSTTSSRSRKVNEGKMNDFTYAEAIGRNGENCENVFHQCTFSLLDVISVIH